MEKPDNFLNSQENINLPPADANIHNEKSENRISAKKLVESGMIINKSVAFQEEYL